MAKKIFTDESLSTFVDEIKSYTDESSATRATKGHGIYYGTCTTAAATAAKVVTLTDATGFSLTTGAVVVVKFTNANSVASPTLNVNSTGAKSIMRYGTTVVSTDTTTTGWIAGAVQVFVYDGTNWVRDYWNNTTYSNASMGTGYATCTTAAATTAKVGTLSSYVLSTGGVVSVKFTYAVPASATLNINSKGAKSIYYRGDAITADIIKAGDVATFVYNGTYYHLIAIDRWQEDIETLQTELDGKAASSHNHAASEITSGTLSSDRLPTVPITKGGTGATTASGALTNLGITATAAELNKLDGITATTAELNYVDGVTSNIQAQLDAKQATITGGATTIASSNLTASRALVSDSSGKVAVSAVTSTELGYLDGVTSNVQTQLDGKSSTSHEHSASKITSGILAIEQGGTGNSWGLVQSGALDGTTVGALSTAEGRNVTASGDYSHAEGNYTEATGFCSHAEGQTTFASGSFSHTEGEYTEASGKRSHAEGDHTIAASDASHVQGKYNIADEDGVYAHIVGNGTSDSARSNAHTLDWDGNAWFAGDIYVGGTSQDNATSKVATETSLQELQAQAQVEANALAALLASVTTGESEADYYYFTVLGGYGVTNLATSTIKGNGVAFLPQYYIGHPCVAFGDGDANGYQDEDTLVQVYVPEGYTHIYMHAIDCCYNLTTLYLPSTITFISAYAFSETAISHIYYNGTATQWAAITKEDNWDAGEAPTIYFNDGTTEG